MPVYVPTFIGEIGAFVFNIIVLYLLIKYDYNVEEHNRAHNIKKTPMKKTGIAIYFTIWVAVSIIAWYVFHFVQLGEFFALSVVLPCVIMNVLAWLQIIR